MCTCLRPKYSSVSLRSSPKLKRIGKVIEVASCLEKALSYKLKLTSRQTSFMSAASRNYCPTAVLLRMVRLSIENT